MCTFQAAYYKKNFHFSLILAAGVWLIFSLYVPVFAQQERTSDAVITDESAVNLPTIEKLDERVRQLKTDKDLQTAEEQKKQIDNLIEIYERTKVQLTELQKYETAIAEFQKAREEAPKRLEDIKAQLAQMGVETTVDANVASWSLTQIEQKVTQLEAELANAKKNAADRESDAKRRTERRTEIPQVSVQTKEQLDSVRKELEKKPDADVPAEVAQARRVLLVTTEKNLQARLDSYNEEIRSYDARGELLAARRDMALRQAAQYEKLIEQWRGLLDKKRKAEAENAAQMARKASHDAAKAHPVVRKLAEDNTKLAELRSGTKGLVATNALRAAYLKEIDKRFNDLKTEFNSVREKVKAAGLTDVIGVVLLGKRNNLPDLRKHERNIKNRQSETAKARFDWIEYDEQYTEQADINSSVEEIIRKLEPSIDKNQKQEIEAEVRDLLQSRKELLNALIEEYEIYLGNLADLDVKERQLVAYTKEYADYIDENIIWVKSTWPLTSSIFPRAWDTLGWLFSPQNWYPVMQAYISDFKNVPFQYIVAIFVFVIFLFSKRRLRNKIEEISPLLRRKSTDQFSYTLKVFIITFVLAAIFPAALMFLGLRLAWSYQDSEFVGAVAVGFQNAALIYLILNVFRMISLSKGLAAELFQISEGSMKFLYRSLSWFMICILPIVFIVVTVDQQAPDIPKEGLGRLVFMAGLIFLTIFLAIVMRPSSILMKGVILRNRGKWVDRLKYAWFAFFLILPLALAITAAQGYYYTAKQLFACLLDTILLVFGVIIFSALMVRWLTVTQYRLLMKKHNQRVAASAVENKNEASVISPENEIDPYHMSLQTRRLIRAFLVLAMIVGLWLIWNQMLPALRIFNRIELWKTTVADITVSITLANLALAIIIILMTVVAARNILGLLEIMILQRLPLDRGVRFAVVTLTRYVIVIIGVILAFGEIGIGWSKVQWLVAAITVGLGFGLQEIFANFISGLIMLFEQPMRVGDIVTVGDISGKVTRIRIRATTIQKWDRKELVVPNKEFITGRLINWTLSDTVLRMAFNVGIAYGSDTALAEKVLLQVARENAKVLHDPPPIVIFKAFGSSALEFELRLYIPDLDSYLEIWHQVNCAIDAAFRKAGIEIAFPQQDIHVRSIQYPIPVDMKKEGGK